MDCSQFTERDHVLNKYFNDIRKYKPLTKEQEKDLVEKGCLEKLICSNLRYVVTIAKKYQSASSLSLNDLIEEGNRGLITASTKFNTSYDTKFFSYAKSYIKQTIIDAINKNARIVYVPSGAIKKNLQIKKKIDSGKQVEFDRHEYDSVFSRKREITETMPLYDNYQNDMFSHHEISESLNSIINKLNPSEKKVIKYYYGINDCCEKKTIAELSSELKKSQQRILKIKEIAIRKLRHEAGDKLFTLYQEN